MHDLLRPGGRLHLVEFHPVTHWCLSETELTVKYSYFHEGPWIWEDDPDEPGSYADPDATFEHNDTVEWNHGIGAGTDPETLEKLYQDLAVRVRDLMTTLAGPDAR